MNDVKKASYKPLIISAVLVVLLAISSLWLYTRIDGLENQINTLETDKANLQGQVTDLQTDKTGLQTQVGSLETENDQLRTWLDGNKTQLQTAMFERHQLQTWLDGNITDYESQLAAKDGQIQNLNSEIADLNSQIDSLNAQIESLNSQINSLNAQITSLQSEIDSLKAPQLHEVEVYWTDNHPLIGSPYVNIYGSIFNSGSQTAYSVVCTVRVYDVYDTLLKTEPIHLGNIEGKSYQSFDVDIEYSGDAENVTTTLGYEV